MRISSPSEIQVRALEQIGLDSASLDFSSPEALSTLLRRVAAFLCPCSSAKLVSTTFGLVEPLVSGVTRDTVSDIVDAVISFGDLIETSDISGETQRQLIYAVPPSYVEVSRFTCLLIGVGPDGLYPLPESLTQYVEYTGHFRKLRFPDSCCVADVLSEYGLIEVSADTWMRCPGPRSFVSHVRQYDQLLDRSGTAGSIDELRILDSRRPVTYYPGRWKALENETGSFVARRPQAYGADLWCYVRLENGRVVQLLTLPLQETRWRPCDEAWHLQLAIDAQIGSPQLYELKSTSSRNRIAVNFYSPLPGWARRRWDCVGTPALATGCLLSYVFEAEHIEKELEFARERMWLKEK